MVGKWPTWLRVWNTTVINVKSVNGITHTSWKPVYELYIEYVMVYSPMYCGGVDDIVAIYKNGKIDKSAKFISTVVTGEDINPELLKYHN